MNEGKLFLFFESISNWKVEEGGIEIGNISLNRYLFFSFSRGNVFFFNLSLFVF